MKWWKAWYRDIGYILFESCSGGGGKFEAGNALLFSADPGALTIQMLLTRLKISMVPLRISHKCNGRTCQRMPEPSSPEERLLLRQEGIVASAGTLAMSWIWWRCPKKKRQPEEQILKYKNGASGTVRRLLSSGEPIPKTTTMYFGSLYPKTKAVVCG